MVSPMPAAGSQIACNPRTSFERPESLLKAISTRWIPIWAPCVRIRLGFKSIAQSRAHFDLRGRTEASIPRRGCTPRTKHGPRSLVKPLCSVFGRDAPTNRKKQGTMVKSAGRPLRLAVHDCGRTEAPIPSRRNAFRTKQAPKSPLQHSCTSFDRVSPTNSEKRDKTGAAQTFDLTWERDCGPTQAPNRIRRRALGTQQTPKSLPNTSCSAFGRAAPTNSKKRGKTGPNALAAHRVNLTCGPTEAPNRSRRRVPHTQHTPKSLPRNPPARRCAGLHPKPSKSGRKTGPPVGKPTP
jgi:hypothetical protein